MNQKQKKVLFSSIGIVTALLITLGITYAVFTYSKKGSTGNTITTGKLTFLYTENTGTGTGINITNAFPVSDELGKAYSSDDQVFDFKVESEIVGEASIPYEVTVGKTSTSTLGEEYVKLYLTDTTENVEEELMSPIRYSELSESSTKEDEKQIYFDEVEANEDYLKKFRLRMWIADTDINGEEINQADINGKTLAIKVNVYSNSDVIKQKINVLNVVAKDKDGKDLNASSAFITGSEKKSLLNKLVNDGYIDNTNKVNALVEIDTDDFDNTASTTINVSSIASVGDKIVVFHYNETTNKWDYITTAEVSNDLKIEVDFNSFSPVGLVVVKNNDFTGINLDDIAPTIDSFTASVNTQNSSVTLNIAATDNVGVISYKYGKSAVNSSVCSPTIQDANNSYVFTGLNNGTYTFCVVAIDEAGNESNRATLTKSLGENIHITLNLDKTGNTKFLSDSFNGITDAVVYVDGQKQSSFVKNYTFATAGKHSVDIYPIGWNSMENMFNGCQYITSVKFNDLNTHTNFTSLEGMFKDCTNLRYVDLSEFDKVTSNVTTLKNMFKGCSNIESIDMSNVNLSKVNNLESTFEGCRELSKVEFANTRTSELLSIENIIVGAKSLCHLDLSNFVLGSGTNFSGFPSDCDNRDFLFSDDIDFITLMSLGCNGTGGGNGYYNLSNGSCESSCSLYYERKCVEQCPSYTSKEGNTCIRTSDWYKQFEP